MKKSHIIAIIIAVLVVGFIGFMGIVALIAVPNLTGIQDRAQVNADIRTAETIGRAYEIARFDGIEVPSTAIEYNKLIDDKYIMSGMEPNSLEDAEFYIVNYNGTIRVAIAKNAEDVNRLTSDEVDYEGKRAGWAYIEEVK